MRIGIDCRKVADFGIGTYVRGLTRALAAQEGSEELVLFAPAQHRHLLPDTSRTHFVESSSPHYSVEELFSLAGAARRLKVDLFHAPHYVVPFTNVPLVVTVHDLIHLRLPPRRAIDRSYARWMIGRAIRKSARVLTVSDAVRQEIAERFQGSEKKIVVTPNGVDPVFRQERGPDEGALLERLGIAAERYFLFVGNRKPHKNLERLLEAWKAVGRQDPCLRLVLAGGDWSDAQLPEGVSSTGLLPIGELATLYRHALGVVQPSIEEGFGLPVAEAMASGTPVICSTIPALIEVAGNACLPIDPFDHQTISGAMIRLARDLSVRQSLRAAGLKRAAAFTWASCAAATLRVYREVAGRSR